jgi:cytochrome c
MKKAIITAVTFGLVSLASTGVYAGGSDIAKKNNCLVCHDLDKKKMGPSFNAISEKYKGNAGARERIINSFKEGSVGVWGKMPMPAQKKVSDEDAGILADYIVDLKK